MRQSRLGLNGGGPTGNSASGNCASVSPTSLSLSSSSTSSSSPSTTALLLSSAAPPMDSSNSSFLYRKSYPNSDSINGSFSSSSIAGSIQVCEVLFCTFFFLFLLCIFAQRRKVAALKLNFTHIHTNAEAIARRTEHCGKYLFSLGAVSGCVVRGWFYRYRF